MIKQELNKDYEMRLMPNFHKISEPIIELKSTIKQESPMLIHKYFSYDLVDGKIDTFMFSKQLRTYIDHCIRGFFGTSEGYFISENEVESYYANIDKSIISTDEFKYADDVDFYLFKDVVYYERIVLFDVKCKYNLTFKTRENHSYMETYNIGIKEVEPVYMDGDDKNYVYGLYENVEPLKDAVENYKREMVEKYPEHEFLFDEEDRMYYGKKRFSTVRH